MKLNKNSSFLNSERIPNNEKLFIFVWLLTFSSVLIYRIVMLVDYNFLYTDDDQAIMWYATCDAANFKLLEPHFYGQNYNSMLESILAVPMYWLGVPLNFCLPIAGVILWFSPFVLISIVCAKNKKYLCSILAMSSAIMYNWRYDLLTNVPRAFISGFIIAFIGILLLLKDDFKSWKTSIAIVLIAISYICTGTVVTIALLTVAYWLLYQRRKLSLKSIVYILIGIAISIILVYFCNHWFYEKYPDYTTIGYQSLSLDFDISLISWLRTPMICFSTFSIINIKKYFPIVLVTIILLAFNDAYESKKYKNIVMFVLSIIGTMAFFFVGKIFFDYSDDYFFLQSRFFLFIPFIILLFIYFMSEQDERIKNKDYVIVLIALLTLVISISKICYFEKVLLNDEKLYDSFNVPICSVEEATEFADNVAKYANSNNAKLVVFTNEGIREREMRHYTYVFGSLYYDKLLSYNAVMDRRTKTYLYLKNNNYTGNVVFVYLDQYGEFQMYSKTFDDVNVIEWLIDNLHERRTYTW